MLINLIYASSARQLFTAEELVTLLTKARQKNRDLGVTGMLLYKGGNFLQVLEGEEKAVTQLFEVIKNDPRHYDVALIAKRLVGRRSFGDWEMGFTDLDQEKSIQIPGFTQYLQEPLNSERFKDPSFAATFLEVFKQGIR